MCSHSSALTFENILADTLVQLVMASDGVSEAELRLVLENARRAVVARNFEAGIPRDKRSRTTGHDARMDAMLWY
jgi:hypothetical protein